jgi:methanethiol S-methyltransferase
MMAVWQPTGVKLWTLPLHSTLSFALSFSIYWFFILYAGHLLTRFGVLDFVGIRQLRLSVKDIQRTEGTPELIITGIGRWVRHPVYTCTLLAFILTPQMSLDRLLITAATSLYLAFGIPVEERKLIRQFGQKYLDYRKRTPALIPWLKAKKTSDKSETDHPHQTFLPLD